MLAIVRLVVIVGVLLAIGLASMVALTQFVKPEPREQLVTVPASRFNK